MADPNRELLESAVRLLHPLLDELVFIGGCTTGLLLTDAAAGGIRPTKDGLDLDQVFTEAEELSTRYAAKHLPRSLDLLHVAAAHAAGCTRFVSADDRQLAVAKATGLKTVDIKRGGRR